MTIYRVTSSNMPSTAGVDIPQVNDVVKILEVDNKYYFERQPDKTIIFGCATFPEDLYFYGYFDDDKTTKCGFTLEEVKNDTITFSNGKVAHS